MTDKLTIDDLLVVLIEECAEVTKAATKCLRFGFYREHEGYGRNNVVLSEEVGDLLGVVDALQHGLVQIALDNHRNTKLVKMEMAKREFGS